MVGGMIPRRYGMETLSHTSDPIKCCANEVSSEFKCVAPGEEELIESIRGRDLLFCFSLGNSAQNIKLTVVVNE